MKTKVTFLFSILLALPIGSSFGQAPDTAWTRAYGGPNGEGAYDIDRTSDGGYIVTGEIEPFSFGATDVYLMKVAASGDTIWTRNFGDANTNEIGRAVRESSDGGFIIAGYAGIGQENAVYLLKTDANGDFEWENTFAPTPDNRGHGMIQTSDGGYIIVGQAWIVRGPFGSYDVYVVKTNSQGGLQWERFMGGDSPEFAMGVCETQDGDFVIAGKTQSFGGWDAYLIKLSAAGDSIWARSIGFGAQTEAYEVMAPADGSGLVFTGVAVSANPGDANAFLAHTDNDGNVIWSETYGTPAEGFEEYGESFTATPDGGYVIAGLRATQQTGWNVYIVKTDSLGNQQWTDDFGADGDDRGYGVVADPDGGIVVAGWTTSYGGGWLDVYLVKLEGDVSGINDGGNAVALPAQGRLGQNYPNPFNAGTRISYEITRESNVTIKIYDAQGRKLETLEDGFQPAGNYYLDWKASDYPSGIYFYRLRVGDFSETRRMTLVK